MTITKQRIDYLAAMLRNKRIDGKISPDDERDLRACLMELIRRRTIDKMDHVGAVPVIDTCAKLPVGAISRSNITFKENNHEQVQNQTR